MEDHDQCNSCSSIFYWSPTSPRAVFCPPCRKLRNSDLIEIITSVDSVLYCNNKKVSEAEVLLRSLAPTDLRLDLHNTLDTIEPNVKLIASASCISYVGATTSTRIEARKDIQNRFKTGQFKFRALVFKRGSRRRNTENTFSESGSKAWFNLIVPSETTAGNKVLFGMIQKIIFSCESVRVRSVLIRAGRRNLPNL